MEKHNYKYDVLCYYDVFDWSVLTSSDDLETARKYVLNHKKHFINCKLLICENENNCVTTLEKEIC